MNLLGRVRGLRGNALARNASWAFVANIGQLVISVGTFVVLARVFGPEQFGYFSALTTMAVFVGSFAYIGVHRVIVMKLATGSPFQDEWARRSSLLTISSLASTLGLVLLQPLLLPEVSTFSYILIVVNQMWFFGLTELAVSVAQAFRQLDVAASVRGMVGVIRLASIAAFVVFGDDSLDQWAIYTTLAGLMSVAITAWQLWLEWGIRPEAKRPSREDVREGFPFALNFGATNLMEAIDRPMLVRFGFSAEAGFYTAGYRIATMGMIPVEALARASDADFFQKGARGAQHAVTLFRQLVLPTLGITIATGLGLFVIAPVLPLIVGSEYEEAIQVIRWLALLPLVRGMQMFPSNAIIASGKAMVTVWFLLVAALVNFSINMVLIPAYDWRGALIATYICEIGFAIALWVYAARVARGAAATDVPAPAPAT